MPLFALSLFLSALLLFQVQPIIARYILPWHGGSPAVWTTCMLCFQVGLLLGYTYAHCLSSFFRGNAKRQLIIHGLLILVSLLWLPITPDPSLAPTPESNPVISIIILLSQTVGLPFIVISASGPLLQAWFSQAYPNRSPYRLYAVSNFGSLLGLCAYPILIEPNMGLQLQTQNWSWAYVIYCSLAVLCAWRFTRHAQTTPAPQQTGSPPSIPKALQWILLAALGSVLLIAITNQISQDIAVMPFIWILPLSLYLITFIICFDHSRWYQRSIWIPLTALSVGATVYLLHRDWSDEEWHIGWQIFTYCSALFTCCMVCHGELVRTKPPATNLTFFYLMISLGGALGGIFSGILAPILFSGNWELHCALMILAIYIAALLYQNLWKATTFIAQPVHRSLFIAWAIATFSLAWTLKGHIQEYSNQAVLTIRNFYGVVGVYDTPISSLSYKRSLYYGRISHGAQLFSEDTPNDMPLSYYMPSGGAGIAYNSHPNHTLNPKKPLHIGVVGLGVGSLASYAQENDSIRFYEINPDIVMLADQYFGYTQSCVGELSVVLGDARMQLQRELKTQGAQSFDLLYLDAFNGDAIPVHLLTVEAFELYIQHLTPGGVLALHISNLHLDLRAPIKAISDHFELDSILIHNTASQSVEHNSTWILMSASPKAMTQLKKANHQILDDSEESENTLWTDDYSNLWRAMK